MRCPALIPFILGKIGINVPLALWDGKQQVLRLNIAPCNAVGVGVAQRTQERNGPAGSDQVKLPFAPKGQFHAPFVQHLIAERVHV